MVHKFPGVLLFWRGEEGEGTEGFLGDTTREGGAHSPGAKTPLGDTYKKKNVDKNPKTTQKLQKKKKRKRKCKRFLIFDFFDYFSSF